MSSPFLGGVYMFAGNFAPKGYLYCDGQILPINQYTALFSLLGTTYGGNGVSTFALPDLRSRSGVGAGTPPALPVTNLGQIQGAQQVTLLPSNLPAHNHQVVASSNVTVADPSGNVPGNTTRDSNTLLYDAAPVAGVTMNAGAIANAGANIPISVMNPYLGINYIIAMVGLYPSRN